MVELRPITPDNFQAVVTLEVNDSQKSFVATNIRSLAQAYVAIANKTCIPKPYAIYAGETLVGFIMLSYGGVRGSDPEDEPVYSIWRLMIDKHHQGKGYGRQAMTKALELIRTFPHGSASRVVLSYEPENTVARALYATFGFVETGEMNGDEVAAALKL